jgi:hypothetical protein
VAPAAPRVDWEAERRRAIAALSIEGEHKRDFSTPQPSGPSDDDFARHAPPTGAIFDAHAARGSSAAPSGARSGIGKVLRGACQAFMGFCADNVPTNYFIIDVRPDYLTKLPQCTDLPGDVPAFEPRDGIPFRNAKCKLVAKEWRAPVPPSDR